MAVPKEERLFVELARRGGRIAPDTAERALARAEKEKLSAVEVLIGEEAIGFEGADQIRKELLALSFTCRGCKNVDYVEPGTPRPEDSLCEECRKKPGAAPPLAPAPPPAVKKTTSQRRTFYEPSAEAKATPPDTFSAGGTRPPDSEPAPAPEVGPAPPPAKKTTSQRRTFYESSGAKAAPPDTFSAGATRAATTPPSSPGAAAEPAAPAAPAPQPTTIELAAGQTIGGCKVEKRIGQGGMGRVYKGHHGGLDRAMAIKILDERLVARQGFVEQFFAEARTLAKLDHPNIVRVFNVDKDANGVAFIVMELLEGGSVDALWRTHQKRLPIDEAVRVVREAGEGLAHAHKAGLIHRDVKPGNLMLTADGRVKVVDFGLAVRTEGELFVATEIAGTPLYMAPEQADGLKLDARCDQYALGITLYQLVCGKAPFERQKPMDILFAHMSQPPPPLRELRPDVPEWLERVVMKMLAKAPGDRYPSLTEVANALGAKDAKTARPAASPATTMVNAAEVLGLEKGLAPRPVPKPSWRPAALAIAGSLTVAAAFLLFPARRAIAGTGSVLGDVPAWVARLERETLKETAEAGPEELAARLARLGEAIESLGPRPGAASLDQLKKAVTEKLEARRGELARALEGRVGELLAAGRYGRAIDLADPASASLAAAKLEDLATKLRGEARARLEKEKGEVWIPAGPFQAGPAGKATDVAGFYLERTEVTNEAWARVREKAGLPVPASWPNGQLPEALARRPVTGVSLEDARRYAAALGKRLPRPLEWEKAARGAADARSWPWGDVFEEGRAHLGTGTGLEDVEARKGDQSPYGVLGLAGNALEWLEGAQVAGGGFRSPPASARVFARFALEATRPDPAVGFRCARDPEE